MSFLIYRAISNYQHAKISRLKKFCVKNSFQVKWHVFCKNVSADFLSGCTVCIWCYSHHLTILSKPFIYFIAETVPCFVLVPSLTLPLVAHPYPHRPGKSWVQPANPAAPLTSLNAGAQDASAGICGTVTRGAGDSLQLQWFIELS